MLEIISSKHKSIISQLLRIKRMEALKAYPMLPQGYLADVNIDQHLETMIEAGTGFLYHYEDAYGFIFSYEAGDMFYSRPGFYTPEWGYFFPSQNHLRHLLDATYNRMSEKGAKDHAISLLESEQDLIRSFFDRCYGSRCMDAHASVKVMIPGEDFNFEEASEGDMAFLVETLEEHHDYMNGSPTFLGFDFEAPEEKIRQMLKDARCRIIKIQHQGRDIGFTTLHHGTSGGCHNSADEKTLGIATTHKVKRYKACHISDALCAFYHQYALTNGFKTLTVDYESMNPIANTIWPRYFTPTIRSLVRNIG